MRIFLFLLAVILLKGGFAQKPAFTLTASGNVTDVIKDGKYLYVATDNGTVDVFNFYNKKRFVKIVVPDIKDFMGDDTPSKVFSVDKFPNCDTVLIVCQGESGFRDLYIYYNDELIKIIDATADKMLVKEARFVTPESIILGLTSDELVLFDIQKKESLYRKQISQYTFSDLVLDESKTKVFTSDESGIVRMFSVSDGTFIKKFEGENVDNIFKIDVKNNILICGGQDRRIAVYNANLHSSYHIQSNFLVYCVGLSPSAKYGAYLSDEDNTVTVFEVATQKILFNLKGSESTLTNILFYSDNQLITSCESDKILFWKL